MRLIRVQLIPRIDGTARALLRGVMLTWLAPPMHDTNNDIERRFVVANGVPRNPTTIDLPSESAD